MEVTFRPGTVDNAKVCGAICYEAFAEEHRFPPDFPSADVAAGLLNMVLSRKDIYSVVAERDRRVIGSNFLWERDTIAGMGRSPSFLLCRTVPSGANRWSEFWIGLIRNGLSACD